MDLNEPTLTFENLQKELDELVECNRQALIWETKEFEAGSFSEWKNQYWKENLQLFERIYGDLQAGVSWVARRWVALEKWNETSDKTIN